MPASHTTFTVPIGATEHRVLGPVFSTDPTTGAIITPGQALAHGYIMPGQAEISLKLGDDDHLFISWVSDIATAGEAMATRDFSLGEASGFSMSRSRADDSSLLPARTVDWAEFRGIVEENLGGDDGLLFRGQAQPWRLRTSFHRTGRSNLHIYNSAVIVDLHRTLSAQTRHYYRIGDPDERGSFYALAQHHGFPTPLLDWTRSPYVAAYFAFRRQSPSPPPGGSARIYMFRANAWQFDHRPISYVALAPPHISQFESVMIDNSRIAPQQGLFTSTNVDDIESFIMSEKLRLGRQQSYLEALDLPWAARENIMGHLASMGITAASMFPGLDGVCEAFSWKHFRI